MHQGGWRLGVKRGVDIVGAAIALALFSPLFVATAVVIGASMGQPVLFTQRRPGRHGVPFNLVKFRTMSTALGPEGALLTDKQRLTRVGKAIRALSLDELPQLWNVLRGEMSLVGPRPLLMQYLTRYNKQQARRHDVLPGITGWAQVNGRNALSHEERFELDIWYVDNWSLSLDARVLMLTLGALFKRSGIASPGHVTMPEFLGNQTSAAQVDAATSDSSC